MSSCIYTFYEANEAGTGYATSGTAYYVEAEHKFIFPECSNVPDSTVFAGWKQTNDAPASLTVSGITELEGLKQAGDTITIGTTPPDLNYYARYAEFHFGGGLGTMTSPFVIATTTNLNELATAVNNGYTFNGIYFKQTADLEYDGTTTNNYTPIGTSNKYFDGTFDGQGHYIKGINISSNNKDYQGVFGYVGMNGTVKNLTLKESTISADEYVGGIVGYLTGKVSNCHVTEDVTIQGSYCGGIMGQGNHDSVDNSEVEGCTSAATVGGSSCSNVGGIVGYITFCNMKDCLYMGSSVQGTTNTGALIGYNATGKTTLSSNYYLPKVGVPSGGIGGKTGSSNLHDDTGATKGYTVSSGTEDLTLDYGSSTGGYDYDGIEIYSFDQGSKETATCLFYGDQLYTGATTKVTFTPDVAEGYVATNVEASSGTLTDNHDYTFTLTMNNANVDINATVTAVASLTVAAAEDWDSESKSWVFIASPVVEAVDPSQVYGLEAANLSDYDLYRLNNTTWENFKAHESDFCLENGRGYLYATKNGTTLIFAGDFNNESPMTVDLSEGWNLVGNPFTAEATVNSSYYKMNGDGDDIEASLSTEAIPTCTGVVVQAASASSVIFTKSGAKSDGAKSNGKGSIVLSIVGHDKAIVSFNEGTKLGKFIFNENHAKIYFTQGNEDYAIAYSDGKGEMPLNFKAKENGTYTISVNSENVEMAYLHLIDNLTGADEDLLASPTCTFTAKTTDYASRFRLVFSVCGDADGDNEVFAFINNGNIIITDASSDATLQIVDVTGRVIVSRGGHIQCFPTSGMPAGVYVLRLIDGENIRTQKIVIE